MSHRRKLLVSQGDRRRAQEVLVNSRKTKLLARIGMWTTGFAIALTLLYLISSA